MRLEGGTLYIQYDCPPCAGCCDAIIQAGIKIVISGTIPFPGKGKGEHYDVADKAKTKLKEAGIRWRTYHPSENADTYVSHVKPEIGLVPD